MTKTPDPKEVERLASRMENWAANITTSTYPRDDRQDVLRTGAAALRALVLRNQELEQDAARLDWLERVFDVKAEVAPHIHCGAKGTVIWDQYHGLTEMSRGATMREAIDAARESVGQAWSVVK